MKKLLLATLGLVLGVSAQASDTWTLQGKTYYVDTLRHITTGPGTTQTSLELTGAQKLHIHYTTTDLTNPYVDIRVTKGSKKRVGCQTLSTQRKNYEKEGAHYFSGVNADFFGNSAPIGHCVVDGEVMYAPGYTSWISWWMTDDKKPGMGLLQFSGTATFPSGGTHAVSGINCDRLENYLVVYNKYHNGSSSGTNMYGWEVGIQPIEGDLGFTGKSRYKVISAPASAGNMAIPVNGYVLSGHGTAAAYVSALKVGDEVALDLTPGVGNITQIAGGQPMILSKGETLNTQGALDHLTALNPRTAVGTNADGTKLVLLVVDGRVTYSVGVVSKVLADIMRQVGCTEAMNFDGGGSSELYNVDLGIINHPSDGTERAVTNAVWCVATAPTDNTIAGISFTDTRMVLPKYGFYTPQIYGYNKYGVLIDMNVQGVTLSCDPVLGVPVDGGLSLFANGSGTHALTATYGDGITCTIPVTIGTGEPKMRLESAIVDGYRKYQAEVTASVGDLEMPVDNKALTWHSEDAAIATVDEQGYIHGVANGTTNIVGTVEAFSGKLPVTVQIPGSRHITVDPERNVENWTVSKTSLKTASVEKTGDETFDVKYNNSSTRGPKVTVKLEAKLHALPDSVRFAFDPGEAALTTLTVTMGARDDRGTSVSYNLTPVANTTNVVTVPVSDFVDVNDFYSYPVTLTSFALSNSDATGVDRTISFKALQSVHTALKPGSGVDDIAVGATDGHPTTTLWYDLSGRRLGARPTAPGIYIERQGSTSTKVIIR